MDEEAAVLRDVTERLNEAGIPYMLTGSLALCYYALPRMTRDIDMVIDPEHRSAGELCALFDEFYFVFEEAVASALKRRSMFNLIHKDMLIKADLIVRKQDPHRVFEFEHRQQVTFRDIPVSIVRKEDLIIAKLIWAKDSKSRMQLGDVRSLLATGCEMSYIKAWVEKIGLKDIWREVADEGHDA